MHLPIDSSPSITGPLRFPNRATVMGAIFKSVVGWSSQHDASDMAVMDDSSSEKGRLRLATVLALLIGVAACDQIAGYAMARDRKSDAALRDGPFVAPPDAGISPNEEGARVTLVSLAVQSGGNDFALAYLEYPLEGGQATIRFNELKAGGALSAARHVLTPSERPTDLRLVPVSRAAEEKSGFGGYYLLYETSEVRVLRLREDGSLVGDETVSTHQTGLGRSRIFSTAAGAVVTYEYKPSVPYQVFARSIDAMGVPGVEESLDSNSGDQRTPRGVAFGDGALFAWRDFRSAAAIRVSVGPGEVSSELVVAQASQVELITLDEARALVTWSEDERVMGMVVDAQGQPIEGSAVALTPSNRYESMNYSLARGSARAVIAWESDELSVLPQIHCRRLGDETSPTVPDASVQLSDSMTSHWYPSIAVDSRDVLAGAWISVQDGAKRVLLEVVEP